MWNRSVAATVSREKLLLNGPADSRIAALTFDDGPHAEHTPAILKVLAYHGLLATFFVTGEKAKRFPDLVARIADKGHVIGQRGYYQQASTPRTEQEFVEELLMTEHWIRKATGESPRLYRPALAKPTMSHMRELWRRKQTIVLWNHDPGDADCPSTAQLSLTLAENPIRGGDVVRLHATAPHTAAALDKMIPGAKCCGVEFGTPVDWLDSPHKNPTDIHAGQ
jgi:peptidoglycan/xylan/chitin deacetylase (PgdA/CDA1 family)